jgi:hypothetical protein
MIRYTVVWHADAQSKLAKLWNESLNRRVITVAANEIDRRLAIDPETKGSDRSDRSRQFVIYPLAVLYRVRELDRIVEVFEVTIDPSNV